jgi:copper chaperone CopZ
MKIPEFKIKGMTSNQCAINIAKKFEGLEGIVQMDINYPSASGRFEYNTNEISKQKIIDVINSTSHYSVEGEITLDND